ncbi:KREPA6 [Leishmania donovani]|uniref:MP18 RNA editing complex protein, putative n=1 Tax=Leishmania donovani TaxID=5661 RepID=A0A3S7XAD1_LEIDO|nr:MP18 RNA editing complex protein, putative [Leishmania donovani]AYU83419.1 MP18 RNA editing complex protein, putative [Leishmania donovani]TPP42367.1 Single-strand binding family protein [Leishmania donovani]TPP48190.1 Single-strand binding family protein [Leishmania donovani]CAJ1993434.1 KREPA6 [Leishmania donovani]CBZ38514.1 MP18 RNA editing complex protein, putative [Leishmania donovani]
MFRRLSSAAATRPMATMEHPLTSAMQSQSVINTRAAVSRVAMRACSITSGTSSGDVSATKGAAFSASRSGQRAPSINCVTLVGVVHDIQTGYVFEDAVTQFTLTTTSLDAANQAQECVVEKDHHTVRCYGDVFSREVRAKLSEGNVVCVNGRLRLNPQMEPSCNKYYYFPYIQVQPPHGQVSVVYGDRRSPPSPVNAATGELNNGNDNPTSSAAPAEDGDASATTQKTP